MVMSKAYIENYKVVDGALVKCDEGTGEGLLVNWKDTNQDLARLFRVDVREVARVRPVEAGVDVEDFAGRVTLAGRVVPEVKADEPVKASKPKRSVVTKDQVE